MMAAVIHAPGQSPVYGEHPAPEAGEGITVVRVTAAPVVPLDVLCATGTSYFGVPRTPYVPGGQGVGTVESSDTFEPGARVWFFTTAGMKPGDGALAELCAVPDVDVVPIVADVPDALAAALGLSGVAAWMALTWRARLAAAERVLVLGGGGAVGQAGIGIARVLDAAEVVALARPASVPRAEAAGADVVLPLETTDVDALAVALADHGPYDVILDPIFGVPATAAARELAACGRLVNLGGASGDKAEFSSASLRSKSAAVLGYTNNALSAEQRRDALTSVLVHAAAGRIRLAFEECDLREVQSTWSRVVDGTAGSRSVLLP